MKSAANEHRNFMIFRPLNKSLVNSESTKQELSQWTTNAVYGTANADAGVGIGMKGGGGRKFDKKY